MSGMMITTPMLLWHGGGVEGGKTDPVLSIDMTKFNILATSGIDSSIPPKGSVRFWKIGKSEEELSFLFEMCDHESSVNSIRFSPCGRMLASASDRQIIIYSVPTSESWSSFSDTKAIERSWLRPCLQEIYDIQWSPDSSYVIAGSIDSKLKGHTSYVQGVAWDPLNQMVATQSADRSCRIFQLKHRQGSMIKLSPKGNYCIRMSGKSAANEDSQQMDISNDVIDPVIGGHFSAIVAQAQAHHTSSTTTTSTTSTLNHIKATNLYADSTVPCFFRRLSFSPDGSLLVTPTGTYVCPRGISNGEGGGSILTNVVPSFCTHIYHRSNLQFPAVSLTGLEDPSVGVRFSPLLYEMVDHADHSKSVEKTKTESMSSNRNLFEGNYRMIFAVLTTTCVYIYDTQHFHPIARIAGCHLAAINDAVWSADGKMLIFCSSDGYVTFVRFGDNILGNILPPDLVPNEVKMAFPDVYNMPIKQITKVVNTPNSTDTTKNKVVLSQEVASTLAVNVGVDNTSVKASEEITENPSSSAREDKDKSGINNCASEMEVVYISDTAHDEGVSKKSSPNTQEKKRKRISPTLAAVALEGVECVSAEGCSIACSIVNNPFSQQSSPVSVRDVSVLAHVATSTSISVSPNVAKGVTLLGSLKETIATSVEVQSLQPPQDLNAHVGESAVQKKTKKRIAPVLVTLPSCTAMGSLSTTTTSTSTSS